MRKTLLFLMIVMLATVAYAEIPIVNVGSNTQINYLTINSSLTNVNNSDTLDGFDSTYFYPASNPDGFISSFTESDPVWVSDKSNYITAGETAGILQGNLTNYALKTEVNAWIGDNRTYILNIISSLNNLSLSDIKNNIGNWSADKSSYATLAYTNIKANQSELTSYSLNVNANANYSLLYGNLSTATGNTSWNETKANGLYYPLTANPALYLKIENITAPWIINTAGKIDFNGTKLNAEYTKFTYVDSLGNYSANAKGYINSSYNTTYDGYATLINNVESRRNTNETYNQNNHTALRTDINNNYTNSLSVLRTDINNNYTSSLFILRTEINNNLSLKSNVTDLTSERNQRIGNDSLKANVTDITVTSLTLAGNLSLYKLQTNITDYTNAVSVSSGILSGNLTSYPTKTDLSNNLTKFVNISSDWVINYTGKTWNMGYWDLVSINILQANVFNVTDKVVGNGSIAIIDPAYGLRWNISREGILKGYDNSLNKKIELDATSGNVNFTGILYANLNGTYVRTEVDPLWSGNASAALSTYNASYQTLTNTSTVLLSYQTLTNSTNTFALKSEPLWSGNASAALSTYNATYDAKVSYTDAAAQRATGFVNDSNDAVLTIKNDGTRGILIQNATANSKVLLKVVNGRYAQFFMYNTSQNTPIVLDAEGTSYIAKNAYNFGIGTSAPNNKLNVVGDANVTGTLYANWNGSTLFPTKIDMTNNISILMNITGSSNLNTTGTINASKIYSPQGINITTTSTAFYIWYKNATYWDCVNATGTIYNRGNSSVTCS